MSSILWDIQFLRLQIFLEFFCKFSEFFRDFLDFEHIYKNANLISKVKIYINTLRFLKSEIYRNAILIFKVKNNRNAPLIYRNFRSQKFT